MGQLAHPVESNLVQSELVILFQNGDPERFYQRSRIPRTRSNLALIY